MKNLLILSTLSLGALALTPGSAQAALLMIDDFNTDGTRLDLDGPAPKSDSATVNGIGGVIGGTRNIQFNLTESPNSDISSRLTVDGQSPNFSVSNNDGANSTAGITYPSLNQTIEPNGSFVFPIVSKDAVPSFLSLSINGLPAQQLPIPAAPGSVSFPISLFGNNITNLSSIAFSVSGDTGYDVRIDQVGYEFDDEVIPEPMTILGTVFALGAIPKLRKAYGKKKAQ